MEWQLRRMTTADVAGGMALTEAAGWNQTERDWRLFLERNPQGSCCAEGEDGRVMGTAATLDYGPFAWVSMVLVEAGQRGKGLGSALFARALELVEEVGCVRLDATPLGEPVYRKLGFVDEYELARWERAPGMEVQTGAEVRAMEDVGEVAALDAAVFGADRRWLLEWLREGAPHLALRCGDGFLLGREGRRFTHLGPLACTGEAEVRALLMAGVAATQRTVVVDAPAGWSGVLEALGFRRQRPLLRMRRGGAAPALDGRMAAIAGPELG